MSELRLFDRINETNVFRVGTFRVLRPRRIHFQCGDVAFTALDLKFL